MSDSLLHALNAIDEFYEKTNSEDFLQLALHTLSYKEDRKHKLYAEDYTKSEWKKIQTLKESAAKIPEICDSATATLIRHSDLPDGLDREALLQALEQLRSPERNQYRANKRLLKDSIRRIELLSSSPDVRSATLRPKLSKNAHAVLQYWNEQEARPTYDEIVTALHMGKTTVKKAMEELRSLKLIPPK